MLFVQVISFFFKVVTGMCVLFNYGLVWGYVCASRLVVNMETRGQRKGRQPKQPRIQRVDNGFDIDQNAEPRELGE